MSSISGSIMLFSAALILNSIIKIIMRQRDARDIETAKKGPPPQEIIVDPQEIDAILKAWGKRFEINEILFAGPLHSSIEDYIKKYDFIRPDEYFPVFDRSLALKPFEENPNFTQIGIWGDGSPIVARRDPEDGGIYMFSSDDETSDAPEVVAKSFEGYLHKAWSYGQDA